jgi:hypothetical protein
MNEVIEWKHSVTEWKNLSLHENAVIEWNHCYWNDMWLTQLSTIFLLYIGGGNHSFEENHLLKRTDLIIQSCIEYKQEFNKYVILVLISWLEHFEWFTQSMMMIKSVLFSRWFSSKLWFPPPIYNRNIVESCVNHISYQDWSLNKGTIT